MEKVAFEIGIKRQAGKGGKNIPGKEKSMRQGSWMGGHWREMGNSELVGLCCVLAYMKGGL